MPSCPGDGAGRQLVVAGRHDDLQAALMQRADRVGRRRLDRIGDGDDAGELAVGGDEHRRPAFGAQRVGTCGQRRDVDAGIVHQRLVAERDARLASTVPGDALAGHRLEILGFGDLRCRAPRRLRRSPRRAGARSPFRGWRRAPADPPRRNPSAAIASVSFGLPSVSVPVLSTISVSTLAKRSSASASLTSTPACAPRPVAVMIDIGVASPSAQGQAMISTETAETMA